MQTTLNNKQPLTTFKTVNGETITGTGNILVSGGAVAGASQVFPELSGKVAGLAIPYNQLSAGGTAWFTDIGQRGVPIVRVDAYWDNIQTTMGGAYNWTALDAVVDGLRANGVHVLLVPNNKPAWGTSALSDLTDRQACADFCGELAAHFVGRCDNFEIVNEPNKTAITAATYADLLKRAYVAIKKANPLATVISGGLAPTMTNGANMTRLPEWVDAFFDVPNIGAYFDQFGMHPYTLPYWLSDPEVANSTAENGWSWMVNLIRPRMVAEGLASKPVAITEMGFVSDSDQAFDGAQGQANAVQEAIDASFALPWVSSFFLYSYKDMGGATTNPEHWFGMIDPAGADKPVAAVLHTATHGGYAGALRLTIDSVTGLQTALTTATNTLATLQAEITTARAQLSAVSTFAAPNAGGIVPGRYYDNSITSATNSNYTSGIDRVDMSPFITSRPLQVDQIGFAVATAGSAAYGRAFVYGCGADGWPSDLIFEGDTNLDLNSANFRAHTLASPITFEANKVYWVGWRFGAATTYAVLRGLNISSSPNLGLAASSNANYYSVVRRIIPFATRMPANWGFAQSDMAASVAPSIRMRAV